jgi:hypothetical protein
MINEKQKENNKSTPFCSTFSQLIRDLTPPGTYLFLNGKKVYDGPVKEPEIVRCKQLPDGKSEITVTEYNTEVDHNPYGDWGNSYYSRRKSYRQENSFFVQPTTSVIHAEKGNIHITDPSSTMKRDLPTLIMDRTSYNPPPSL